DVVVAAGVPGVRAGARLLDRGSGGALRDLRRLRRAGAQRIAFGLDRGGANRAVGDVVEAAHHFDDGAFDASADRELNRLKRAFATGDVDDGVVEEREHAGAEFAANDLLLIRNHVDNLERA